LAGGLVGGAINRLQPRLGLGLQLDVADSLHGRRVGRGLGLRGIGVDIGIIGCHWLMLLLLLVLRLFRLVANVAGTVGLSKSRLAHAAPIVAIAFVGAMAGALHTQQGRGRVEAGLVLGLVLAMWCQEISKAIAHTVVAEPIAEAIVWAWRVVIRLVIHHASHVKRKHRADTQ